jgi:hypothetical protein
MTREGLINYGEMFLEVNNDSKNSNTYEFIEEALKLFKHEESVLDKIRERIELEKLGYHPSAGYYRAIMKCLQIIDKYKESNG